MNHIVVTGNLGKDPVIRSTPNGNQVCSFSVAVNRSWTDGDGDKQEETTWFNVAAWNGLGKACSKYLTKGRKVLVEGRLSIRTYKGDDGEMRTWVEIVANNVEFLDSKRPERDNEATMEPTGKNKLSDVGFAKARMSAVDPENDGWIPF